MTHGLRPERSRRQLLREAVVTLAAVLFAFAAFDDITTDHATSFTFEWVGLGACAVGLLVVSWRLLRSGQKWFGFVSIVALVAASAAGSLIRPGISPVQIEYLTTMAGLLWFVGLAAVLAHQAWRRAGQHAA